MGEVGVEDLECDGTVVAQVASEVHGGHAATAELALEAVATGETLLEGHALLGHRHGGLEMAAARPRRARES